MSKKIFVSNFIPQVPYVTLKLSFLLQKNAVKNHIAVITVTDVNPHRASLETAHRYLVQSHEILLEAHGVHHPAVAAGCLAVASVQNVLEVSAKCTHLFFNLHLLFAFIIINIITAITI